MITLNTVAQANHPTFGNLSRKVCVPVVTVTDLAENYGYPVYVQRELTESERDEILKQRKKLRKELQRPDASSWKYRMYLKHNSSEYLDLVASSGNIQNLMKSVDEKSALLYPKTNEIRQTLVEIGQTNPNTVKPKLSNFAKILVKLKHCLV